MYRFTKYAILAIVLTIAGCAALDRWLLPGPSGEKPQAQATYESMKGTIPSPWAEIGLTAIIAAQNIYLGIRKYQKSKKKT